ncbi:MAG TPA: hypothetical protein VH912_00200 [Streptosporangiaceae bacterium]
MSETTSRDTSSPLRGRLDDDDEEFWPAEHGGPGRRTLLIGAAVALVAVIAVVAVVVLRSGGGDAAAKPAGDRPLPTTYVGTAADQGTAKLNLRSADQRPLTEGEVFGDVKTVSYRKFTFNLAGAAVSSDCQTATWGARLQSDLRQAGCTQLVRGAYLSSDKKYVGQFFAFNLDRAEGAQQIVRDFDNAAGAGFVTPLPAPGVENFGGGFSAAYGEPLGHYMIMSWVQRTGGVRPASLNEMIDASLAIGKAGNFAWERLVLVGG